MVTILQETGSSVDPNIGTMVTAIFFDVFLTSLELEYVQFWAKNLTKVLT